MHDVLLEMKGVVKSFPVRGGVFGRPVAAVQAVRGVTLSIRGGETLGLVGESGCGKTTLGMLALGLARPDTGEVWFDGVEIARMPARKIRPMRREMQVIFQDPYASLNPRMTVGEIVCEPLEIHGVGTRGERRARAMELVRMVGLPEDSLGRYPREFSGGQRQRIGIARAIALRPKFIVADEPVSALDLSIRGEILNLLSDLKGRFPLAILLIAHDLSVVEHMSDRIAVMYLGKMMEIFPAEGLSDARHPYTQAIVRAIPAGDPALKGSKQPLAGDVPSPIEPPAGCPFHPRCRYARQICREREPALEEHMPGFHAACHFIAEMEGQRVGQLTSASKAG